ncbi:MAG: siderophore ABC transporter substrate-binding protein [Silicimonas sp.]|nr:siderophore ABC transporter substrate-binding protein [Silicimonas sp.]
MLKRTALALALLATPLVAEEVTVETYRGEMIVAAAPETIAVFDLSALDMLEALGVKPQGTLENVYLDYLQDAAEGAEVVGSLFEPDFEALNALQPDLIIAGGRSHKVVPELEKMAPTIDMTIWEDTVGQGLDRLTALGAIFGKEAKAAALKTAFEAKLAATRAATAGQGKTLIVMTNGPKVSAYGAAGRFGWLHTALGLEEAVAEVEQATHGEAISFEFIRDADPDILLVIDRAAAIGQEASAKATLDNALVQDTKAWKTGKVVYLTSGPIYIASGGIQSMNGTLDEILAAFAEE